MIYIRNRSNNTSSYRRTKTNHTSNRSRSNNTSKCRKYSGIRNRGNNWSSRTNYTRRSCINKE